MYAYSNILAALLHRQQTGRGQHIDISMLESLVEWMSYPLYYAMDGAAPPARTGASHATIYPYGPFPAGDGKVVMLGLQNEREWLAFCDKVLQQPALAKEDRFATNSKRSTARAELRALIVQTFAVLTAEQVVARLEDAQIANAQVNTMHDVWTHPQLRARDRWRGGVSRDRYRRCCRRARGRRVNREWMRCRRSASIRRQSCRARLQPRGASTRCASAVSDRLIAAPRRPLQPTPPR
jgi:crotonobetainyl-CoA:carnitine CoA-transferase CaiB-like acyl-CoA transferase